MSSNPYASGRGSHHLGGACDGSTQHNTIPKGPQTESFIKLFRALEKVVGSFNRACNLIKVPSSRMKEYVEGNLPLTPLIGKRILAQYRAHKHLMVNQEKTDAVS